MDIFSIPSELLLALCCDPYGVAALRLSCKRFYDQIPRVRDLYTRLEIGNKLIWSNGFWLLVLVIDDPLIVRVAWVQHRITGTLTVTHMPDMENLDTVRLSGTDRWESAVCIWVRNGCAMIIRYREGVHLVENLADIYHFVELVPPGAKKSIDGTLIKRGNTVVWYRIPVRLGGSIMWSMLCVDYKDIDAVTGCEHACKIFRSQNPA